MAILYNYRNEHIKKKRGWQADIQIAMEISLIPLLSVEQSHVSLAKKKKKKVDEQKPMTKQKIFPR